jgi:hypothetical protein
MKVAALAAGILAASAGFASAATDPNLLCHKTIVKQLEKYKKTYLKLYRNCIDKQNRNTIPGPCLDTVSAAKLALTNDKVAAAIAKKCQMSNLATLGYRSDCQYGASTAGIGGTCFNLPVTTPTEFAECMKCWKGAEFGRYVAMLYASHAQEVCGANLDDTSATCSAVGCTSPVPDQRDLGDNAENDCQRMLSKASLNYLLKREKILEKCMLKGLSRGACLADLKVQLQLGKAETQKVTLIKKFCNNRVPTASAPFCCRTGGMGQTCSVAVDRNDCTVNLSGTIMEGKVCGATLACNGGANDGATCTVASECPGGTCDGTCENTPGPNKPFTWWEHCPTNDPCPGPTLASDDDMIDCIDSSADQLVDGLLCLQFPNGAACGPTPTPTPVETPTATPTP